MVQAQTRKEIRIRGRTRHDLGKGDEGTRGTLVVYVLTSEPREVHDGSWRDTQHGTDSPTPRTYWYFLTLLVTSETSFMIASKAAESWASFWFSSAIFSLNFRGFAMMARGTSFSRTLAEPGAPTTTNHHHYCRYQATTRSRTTTVFNDLFLCDFTLSSSDRRPSGRRATVRGISLEQ